MIETGARNPYQHLRPSRRQRPLRNYIRMTAVVLDTPSPVAATVFGGGPGTRELDATSFKGSIGTAVMQL